jgi:phage tail sheath protein FI
MPSQLSYPGVYIEEVSSGVRTITGVATAIAAFAGSAPRGPINKATRLFSFSDYERRFGGLAVDSEMGYAVRQFFQNGGTDCYAVRIVKDATFATTTLASATPANVLKVTAQDPGSAGNGIQVRVDYPTPNPGSTFNISFSRTEDSLTETFPNVSMNSADARYLLDLVRASSKLVQLTRLVDQPTLNALPAGTSTSPPQPDVETLLNASHNAFRVSLNGLAPVQVVLAVPGDIGGATATQRLDSLCAAIQAQVRAQANGLAAYANFTCARPAATQRILLTSGAPGETSSVRVLGGLKNNAAGVLKLGADAGGDDADAVASIRPAPSDVPLAGGTETAYAEADIHASFIPPDRVTRQGIYALEAVDLFTLLCLPGITHTGVLMDADAYCKKRRAFFIIDAPKGVKTPEQMEVSIKGSDLPKSDFAAVYYPWVYIADPLKNGALRLTAPSGTIAGLYARTDAERGVWKAPAGTEAALGGVQKTDHTLTDSENGTLNLLGVNCLRVFPVYGAVAWGARTLPGDPEYKYIPVRRLALFLEESLYRGTQWVVFEPNDEPLWAQIRLNLGSFMHSLFRQGAFQGKSSKEAYLVKCDRETTTQDDINRGVVNILVAFAPLKPAEFVVIRIQQLAGQIQV